MNNKEIASLVLTQISMDSKPHRVYQYVVSLQFLIEKSNLCVKASYKNKKMYLQKILKTSVLNIS